MGTVTYHKNKIAFRPIQDGDNVIGNVGLEPGSNAIGIIQISDGVNGVADLEAIENDISIKMVHGHHHVDIIHLDAENVAAETAFMLIDLSDITNFPHPNTGSISIEFFHITINTTKDYSGDVEIGFLSDVDAANGDFNVIHTFHFDKPGTNERTIMSIMVHYVGSHVECAKTHWLGPTVANSSLFQTDTDLARPDGGNSKSGDGDFVMRITRSTGSIDVGIMVGYHANE